MNTKIKSLLRTLLVGLIVGSAPSAYTATTWTGNTDNELKTAGNWDNGLPTSPANVGTIPNGAGTVNSSFTTDGYYVVQNGGTFTASVASTLLNGSWTLNDGGSFSPNVNFTLQGNNVGSQSYTMNGGTFSVAGFSAGGTGSTAATWNQFGGIATASSTVTLSASADFTLSDGSFNAGSNDFRITDATVTVNGGSLNAGNFGRAATLFFNGGTTNITSLSTFTGFSMTLGGSTAGSLTAGSFNGGFETGNRDFNWLTGSQMTFTNTSTADWAEAEWNAGRLTYNGDGTGILGTWADVTTAGGLDGIYSFAFDGGTNTLSLAAIPEPSTFMLISGGLIPGLAMRRRRKG